LARRLLLLFAMELLGILVLERKAWVGKGLVDRGLGEKARGTRGSYIWNRQRDRGRRSWPYLKKFGKWRDSLNRTVAWSFGIQAESYSV
jgi:hypothetical protein